MGVFISMSITTHLDSTDHYLNNDVSANSDKRSLEEYTRAISGRSSMSIFPLG